MRAVLPWFLIVLAAVLGYLLFAPEDDMPAYELGVEPELDGGAAPLQGVELKGAEKAARGAMEHGVRRVEVQVKGPGSGRETAIRSIQNAGIEVSGIKDVTPVPHNGCRPPKRRRT